MTQRVADLGEDALLDLLLPALTPARRAIIGPGDDAAVVRSDGDQVLTTDLLIEGRDFHLDWSDGRPLGVKAAAQNLADIAAMGARPTGLVVALGLPRDLPVDYAVALMSGIDAEARRAGAGVIGGDISEASELVISIAAHGELAGWQPVRRSGAVPGDVVAMAGRVGLAAAGLDLLLSGLRLGEDPDLDELITAQLAPQPPYALGPAAAAAGARAMIDCSDGMVQDLGRIAAASGVTIDLDPMADEFTRLRRRLSPAGRRLAPAAPGERIVSWLMAGGEDHGLLAAFGPRAELPVGFEAIGVVRSGEPVVRLAGQEIRGRGGYSHFQEA